MSCSQLRISIPKMDTSFVHDNVTYLKSALVYLETPKCRAEMPEDKRREEIRAVTERFRNAIKMREEIKRELLESLYY